MLLVQQFLQNNSFKDLIDKHGVYANASTCGRKVSLNYSQLESSNSDKLSQQCRGLILAKSDFSKFIINDSLDLNQVPGKTKILAYPFNRFFNYGMGDVDIDWADNNIKVVEKLDGTLIIIYFDPMQDVWHVATRSVSEANLSQNGFTFRELFERALKESYNLSFNEFSLNLDVNITYMFELTSFYNRVVVDHKKTSITLIGARDLNSLNEIDVYSLDIGIDRVSEHSLSGIHDILSHVDEINPLMSEGVVAYDSKFRRVKVKSAAYVALHHTISSMSASPRNIITIIMSGQDDDVIANLPDDLAKILTNVKTHFISFAKKIDSDFNNFVEISEKSDKINKRKEFALTLKRYNIKWQSPFFQMYNGKANNFFDFVEKSKRNGDWSNGFKDKILDSLKKQGLNLE